jgi:predicted flap endonuclease-1-like 5' DNA nuclease
MKKLNPFSSSSQGRSWFWWGITLGALAGLIYWLWKESQPEAEGDLLARLKPLILTDDEPAPVQPKPKPKAKPKAPKKPDDLKVIEGIGPKSEEALNGAGVLTYVKLAGMEPDAIQAILREAEVRVPYPETWPEQAALAAAGNWEVLENLQDILQGGRRV